MELLIIIVQELDFPRLSSAFIHNHVLATKFCTEGLYLNKRNIYFDGMYSKRKRRGNTRLYPQQLYRAGRGAPGQ